MIKHELLNIKRDVTESIVEIRFFPETEKEKSLISRAQTAKLDDNEYAYFNNLLISICLNKNYTPIALAYGVGNSFFFRVSN